MSIQTDKVLITGITGLLGSHIASELLGVGYQVKGLVRNETKKQQLLHVLKINHSERAMELFERVEWFHGDVRETMDVEEAMNDCTIVVHCAALVSFRKKDFQRLFQINRQGTANVVNVALSKNIKQLVHISSTAAIGSDSETGESIRRETNHWNANEVVSGYSLSKYSAEKEVWRGIEEGLQAVIVNPSLIFGAGSWDESSLTIFRTIQNGLSYYTKGGNAYVDARDVAEVVRNLMEKQCVGERFLLTGTNTSFKNVFDIMAQKMNVKAPNKEAGPFLSGLAWRLAKVQSWFTGKQATLTKESARSAQQTTVYSSQKIVDYLPDFHFRTLEDTIDYTIRGKRQQ